MKEKRKIAPFKWQFGEENVSLEVGMYTNNRLYIGINSCNEDGMEPFADMTENIPQYPLKENEAFIDGDIEEAALIFIKENNLGDINPHRFKSGYGNYALVAFDLEKLAEFDPEGVSMYEEAYFDNAIDIISDVLTKEKSKNEKYDHIEIEAEHEI